MERGEDVGRERVMYSDERDVRVGGVGTTWKKDGLAKTHYVKLCTCIGE